MNCHSPAPHSESNLDRHTKRVDCSVRHIPAFARSTPTDMDRHWESPGELPIERGLYEPARYMGIFHEVASKEQALECSDCHENGNRMDFAALGYTPRQYRGGDPLFASYHEDESGEWSRTEYFYQVHNKHVKDKKLDCSNCHIFSER